MDTLCEAGRPIRGLCSMRGLRGPHTHEGPQACTGVKASASLGSSEVVLLCKLGMSVEKAVIELGSLTSMGVTPRLPHSNKTDQVMGLNYKVGGCSYHNDQQGWRMS